MNEICGIIDFDGFYVQGTFLVREFGFIDVQKEKAESKRYDLRSFHDSLNPQDSTTVEYVEKKIFGMPFLPLEEEHVEKLEDINNHIRNFYESCRTDNCKILAYKGGNVEKKRLDLLQIPNVNLETHGCPKYSSLKSERYNGITCGYHKDNLRCSEAKVTAYKDWEADAALSGMTMNYERHDAVRFSIPYAFDSVTFVTRKPDKRKKTWAIFWPYTAEVWASLAVSVLFIASFLTWLQKPFTRSNRHQLRFTDSLIYIFQTILNQGYYNAKETRCRILMSFWWGFCITIIAGYNGSLMSFMAHPGFTPALDTIPELVDAVKRGQIDVGTIESSSDFAIFKNSEESDLRVILENMMSNPRNLVHHDTEGLRETQRRRYAYIGGWMTVQADVWDPRLFLFSKDCFQQLQYAIAFNPNFDYADIFNIKILHLRESGHIQRWLFQMIQKNQRRGYIDDRQDTEEQDNDDSDTPMQSSLRIDDVQGAFVVLAIGLLLGISCCILENCTIWFIKKGKSCATQMKLMNFSK